MTDGIRTTDAFDTLPLDCYVRRVLDSTREKVGTVADGFWSESRIRRVENRWRALRQVPEQVACDMAEEHRQYAEIVGETAEAPSVRTDPRYQRMWTFLDNTKHLRSW